MTKKVSISLTDEQARMIDEAVAGGDYASTSEVVREALRLWRTRHVVGRLWDEGIASGLADPHETIDDIIAEARRDKASGGN